MGHVEIRARNLVQIGEWLSAYVLAGHELRFDTRHGPSEDDNELVIRIADWPAFVAIMEPGASLDGRADLRRRVG